MSTVTTNRHPFAVLEADIAKRLGKKARCPIQIQCTTCTKRCRLEAALRAGGSASADLLAEWEKAHGKLVPISASSGASKRRRETSESDAATAASAPSPAAPTSRLIQQTLSFASAVAGRSVDQPPVGSAGSASTASSAAPTTTDPTPVDSTPTTSVTPAGPPQSVFSFNAPVLSSGSSSGMQSNRISNQSNTPAAPINWQQRAEAAEAATASLQSQMQSLTALVTQLVMLLQQGSANVVQSPGTANVAQPLSTAAAFLASISPTPTTTSAAVVPGASQTMPTQSQSRNPQRSGRGGRGGRFGPGGRIVPGAAPTPTPTDPITVTVENPSSQAAEATWTTVARNGARRAPPPPREPRQRAPQTQQQYDESVHRSRQKKALKMAKAVPEPKEFAVLRVELHSSRQLRACSLRERKHLIDAFVGQMGVRHNVALTSSIGNSIIELYCPTDVVLDVAK
ncbi:hypothetical protein HDU77_001320, partial [Chytriomyces hyalinus]